jgi:hypothetical protein
MVKLSVPPGESYLNAIFRMSIATSTGSGILFFSSSNPTTRRRTGTTIPSTFR